MIEFTITPDDGIPVPGMDNDNATYYASHRKKLESLKHGQSFFIPNASAEQLTPFITYADSLDVSLYARDTLNDDIYLQPGVRVWRVRSEQLTALSKLKKSDGRTVINNVITAAPGTEEATAEAVRKVVQMNTEGGDHKWWKNRQTGMVIQVKPNAGRPHGEHWFKVPESMYLEYTKAQEDDEL